MILGFGSLVTLIVGLFASSHQSEHDMIRNDVLHFDGHTRIVTNVKRTLPVTLEAWIKPDPYQDENCQFVFGSDIPRGYGVGVAICGSVLSVEYVRGMVNSSAVVPPNRWSHIAAVFTESETRLYLNGKLVTTAPGSQMGGDTPFVIGNVGENNLIDFFRGEIRSVRISEGERYRSVFDPKELVATDSLLFLGTTHERVRDDQILDDSGRLVGRIERF